MIVGIDFGTCFSSVAIMKGYSPITTYVNEESTQEGIPTRFMYSKESNKELFGKETLIGEAFKNPDMVIKNIKTRVREDPDNLYKKIPNQDYVLADVIEKFLGYLVNVAKRGAARSREFDNTDIDEIAVTVPAGLAQGNVLASTYNEIVRDAVTRVTGLPESHVRILQEPVAAAISYLFGENLRSCYSTTQTILVCDLGGGTFDVTIMEYDPQSFSYKVVDTDGELHLGGNDWDARLADAVLEKVGLQKDDLTTSEYNEFMNKVAEMKIELSTNDETMIFFTAAGSKMFTEITREEFEECSKDLLESLVSVVERITDRLDFGVSQLDKVVLVGGGSNMPQVRDAIVDLLFELDEDDIIQHDPSTAIAKGAAIYAMLKSDDIGMVGDVTVVEAVPHTYGFRFHESTTDELMIYNVIFKGTSFDGRDRISGRTDTSFIARYNDQKYITFTIYESDIYPDYSSDEDYHYAELDTGTVINGLTVDIDIPAEYWGRARSYEVWVRISLDTNGIIDMDVLDSENMVVGHVSNYRDD